MVKCDKNRSVRVSLLDALTGERKGDHAVPDRKESAGILTQREQKLQSARELARKAPLIRKRLEEEEALLARREAEPELRIEEAPATRESREADAALRAVVREVHEARRAAGEQAGGAAFKRSIEFGDEDYVAALERQIVRLNREGKHESAARVRFAHIRQRQECHDLSSDKELTERFLPAVNTAFTHRGLAGKSLKTYDGRDARMRGLDELLLSESDAFDAEVRSLEQRNAERRRGLRIERHMLGRQRNLLKKQELDVKWAEYDHDAAGQEPRRAEGLTLDAPKALARDYVELLKDTARRVQDERGRKELCLRAAIVKTQCAPDELVDTRENKRICDSFRTWAEARPGMSVEEYVAASEKVVTEELERLEIILPEEMQLQPRAPEAEKSRPAVQAGPSL